jgi:hypothetical protein
MDETRRKVLNSNYIIPPPIMGLKTTQLRIKTLHRNRIVKKE